jgi:hypothetical protein
LNFFLLISGTVCARADKVNHQTRYREPNGPRRETPIVRCPRNTVPRAATPPERARPRLSCVPKKPGGPGLSPACGFGCAERPRVAVSRKERKSFGSPLLMSRADLPVSVGMGAVVPCTFPGRRSCGGLGRLWLWRRACLVLWPSYLISLLPLSPPPSSRSGVPAVPQAPLRRSGVPAVPAGGVA